MANFHEEYSKAVNKILKDIYEGTDYWGRGPHKIGIIRPITEKDDPTWSNYNFINSHWTTRDTIVIPFIRQKGFDGEIDMGASWRDNPTNREVLIMLWNHRYEVFGPNSPIKDQIIDAINKTRGYGEGRENSVSEVLNSLHFLDVNLRSGDGSLSDLAGLDAVVNFRGRDYSAQIKPFRFYAKENGNYIIQSEINRIYPQDLMIFGREYKGKYYIMCFWNKNADIGKGTITFPEESLFLRVTYNLKTKRYTFDLNP
jgi:hypothetical protein